MRPGWYQSSPNPRPEQMFVKSASHCNYSTWCRPQAAEQVFSRFPLSSNSIPKNDAIPTQSRSGWLVPELVFSEICGNRRLQPGSKKNAIEDAIRPSATGRVMRGLNEFIRARISLMRARISGQGGAGVWNQVPIQFQSSPKAGALR